MEYYIYNGICIMVGVYIPLLIEIIKGKSSGDFRLRDLSTVQSLLIVYYAVLYMYFNLVANERIFYFFILIHLGLTAALIGATARFTPLRESIRELIRFPRFRIYSGPYIMLFCFFLFTSFIIFSSSEALSGRVEGLIPSDLIMLEAVYNSPFVALPLFILTEIFGVTGEEILSRYFAVNALRLKLKKTSVILISSLIWTLMHWDANPSIFILGLLLGYLYYRTGSLSVCILLHFLYNLAVLTMPFYIFFRRSGDISLSSLQYAAAVFVLQIAIYHSVEILFAKTGRITGNS